MKINNIKKLTNGKYMITTDNKEKIITYDEIILDKNLLFKKEIDESLLKELNISNEYYDIYYKVMKYLAKKMRSKNEVKNYLEKLEVKEDLQNELIEKFTKLGFLNDLNYVKAFIGDKMNLTSDGPLKIRNDLINENISSDIVDSELDKYEPNFIYKKLEHLVIKKIKANNKYPEYVFKLKLVSYFKQLGYEEDMILTCYEANNRDTSNDIVLREYTKLKEKLKNKYQDYELEQQIVTRLLRKGFSFDDIKAIKKDD